MEDFHRTFVQKDEKGRVIAEAYSDGWSFEREFDDNYKNGEVPAIVREYTDGKLTYHREYDKEIVNVRR